MARLKTSAGVQMALWLMLLAALQACADRPRSTSSQGAAKPQLQRAYALRESGRVANRRGQMREAVTDLQSAVALFLAVDAADEVALTLNYLSDAHYRLGEYSQQEDASWRALEYARARGDSKAAADAWNNLGVGFAARGRPSEALAAYHRCLQLRRGFDDRAGEAATQHNIGTQLLLLGRRAEGLAELRQALAMRLEVSSDVAVARTRGSLAWGLALAGRADEALDEYQQTITGLAEAGADYDLAVILELRSQLLRRLQRTAEAEQDLRRARALLENRGEVPRLDEAYLQLGLGAIQRLESATQPAAVAMLTRAVETFDALEAQEGRVLARLELARARRRQGGWQAAAEVLEAAVAVIEAARSDLRLASFRATFLGGWQEVYQEWVDVLAMEALVAKADGHEAVAQDLARQALEVAERARARALLDRLVESRARGAENPLGLQLRQRVEDLEARSLQLNAREAPEELAEQRAALRRARFELEHRREVTAAALVAGSPSAQPASVEELRQQLGDETTLLVYSLAPARSWVWRVDSQGIAVESLAGGELLEAMARQGHELLPLHDRLGFGTAAEDALERLATLILAPILDESTTERIAVVPDGALHLVPFGALPNPADVDSKPLADGHEVVHLPSASSWLQLRRRHGRREPAPALLAVIADPVFAASDPRLRGRAQAIDLYVEGLSATRNALAGELTRLPAAAAEAQHIAAIAHRAQGERPPMHVGLAARRDLVTSGQLDGFRILHFATHGLVDAEDPALAGLVLSLYGADGSPEDGLLRARDLYQAHLSADLVVVSACRTALGEEIRGEGLVGLADGFFAAGASHLIVSLWDVHDEATAELMTRFYRHLLLAGQRPAAALRSAQRELRQDTEWHSPRYWAAFVALGDWQFDDWLSPAPAAAQSPGSGGRLIDGQ